MNEPNWNEQLKSERDELKAKLESLRTKIIDTRREGQ